MSTEILKVLVIEDELQMRRFLRLSLSTHGHTVVESASGRDGIARAAGENPDLVLLDLGLPDLDGVEVTRKLRARSNAPIIVLSARVEEHTKVAALDSGADDYLTKPFAMGELLARIRVVRRRFIGPARAKDSAVFQLQGLHVDFERCLVFLDDNEVHLTPIEYKLLAALVHGAGRVLTHHQLLKEVWGLRYTSHTQYLHVYIGHLRAKLEADPAKPKLLVTEPGIGYRLRAPDGC
jgi:two-component system KDP operon response regulator KdpE